MRYRETPDLRGRKEDLSLQQMRQLKERFVNHLRHYRHDLLNHIQLIKSYLQLDRWEDARRTVDQMVLQAQQESLLSQLGDPELAYLLLMYNYHPCHRVHVEVEINLPVERLVRIGKRRGVALAMVQELLALLERGTAPYAHQEDPRMELNLDGNEDDLHILAEYHGRWDQQAVREALPVLEDKVKQCQGRLVNKVWQEEALALELICPWSGVT